MIPTHRKSAPVTMPWLIICRIPPSTPARLTVKMPRVTKPMWLTLEYAINRLTSLWVRVT
jgi:hypothetical protein